jgi:hypothetical protein
MLAQFLTDARIVDDSLSTLQTGVSEPLPLGTSRHT